MPPSASSVKALKRNRPELAVLRGKNMPESVEAWVEAFAKGDRKKAQKYSLALASFLGQPDTGTAQDVPVDVFGQYSPHTRKAYSYALTEFFEWAARAHGRVMSPEDITRPDTEKYVSWLVNRPFSLSEEKLKDGDDEVLRELYEIVHEAGQIQLEGIAQNLSEQVALKFFGADLDLGRRVNRRLLSIDVRRLVTMDVLTSTPTLEELRESYPQAGITQWDLPWGSAGKQTPLEEVFTYSVKETKGASRLTVAVRVSALSTFWQLLMQGENVSGGAPLLEYDVWSTVKKRVNKGLGQEKRKSAETQKMEPGAVLTMLEKAPTEGLIDLRNRAMLELMVLSGIRVSELTGLRRAKGAESDGWKAFVDTTRNPPMLSLLRKGNKRQLLPYPTIAYESLVRFQHELRKRGTPEWAQSESPKEPNYYPPEHVAWHYTALERADAPLFPPLGYWGANQRMGYRKPLTRIAVFRVLRKIAKEVGISPVGVHPHALRHFAANAMLDGGKTLREVQAILGHSSVQVTEGYLSQVSDPGALDAQDAILGQLERQGVDLRRRGRAEETTSGPEVIDVVGFGVETAPDEVEVVETIEEPTVDRIEEPSPEARVSDAELAVLEHLDDALPPHREAQVPVWRPPDVVAVAREGAEPVLEDTRSGELVGISGAGTEALLEDMAQTTRDGVSPGSPVWVYQELENPKGDPESVVFNRGGERDHEWQQEYYPSLPTNFGVGHESYLPWFVKARGNITRAGLFKGVPPFPVLSPGQTSPETQDGEKFLDRIEAEYEKFAWGDVSNDIAPSPLRSIGLVRWYSFFVYHTERWQELGGPRNWKPFEAVAELGEVRAHDEDWLVSWLRDNAHTFRASVDAMKRGVSRSDQDLTSSFLKASFEGVELLTEMPEWMVYDDPVWQLWRENPAEWRTMVEWLKDVTGQQLSATRKVEVAEAVELEKEARKTQARNVRDVLLGVVRITDQLEKSKRLYKERVPELREQLRLQLYWYALAAGSAVAQKPVKRLSVSLEELQVASTREFNQLMGSEYVRLGIPNPDTAEFQGKKRVAHIVETLFPDLPEVAEANIFGDSLLFDPRWFRIDEDAHTVTLERSERVKLQRQIGRDPELLVRRGVRAMWDARHKGKEALWGVLMAQFAWIVPSGKEMESAVRGIPVDADTARENVKERKIWLRAWVHQMKRLAMGEGVDAPDEWQLGLEEAEDSELEPWERFLRDEARKKDDALDRLAGDGIDFVSAASLSEMWDESPEELLIRGQEEAQELQWNGRVRGLVPNTSGTYTRLEGEQPARWYRVDVFGKKLGTLKPNAAPRYISPGVVLSVSKRFEPVRRLLPSPFRQVSAIELASGAHTA